MERAYPRAADTGIGRRKPSIRERDRIVRAGLRPRYQELAKCRSTGELLAHPTYTAIRPIAERVLRCIEHENFSGTVVAPREFYRLVAWNIERGIEFDGLLRAFRRHEYLRSADVLFLTETDVGMARSGNRNVARELAQSLGLEYAFAPCYLNLSKGSGVESEVSGANDLGLHGNALLSRFPLRNCRRIPLGNGRDKMHGREKRLGQQAALAAEVDLPGLPLTACAVHLDAKSKQSHRCNQMKGVIAGLPRGGPAAIGGDWNTTTFDSSSASRAIAGYWLRVFLGAHNTVKNHFLRPYTYFERGLFRALEDNGFDWRGANVLNERTTSYDVDDTKAHKNLREWVPAWCFDFIRWALREFDGKCPLKIDWFAVRGVAPERPVVFHEFREGRDPPLSDHDAIGLDVRPLDPPAI